MVAVSDGLHAPVTVAIAPMHFEWRTCTIFLTNWRSIMTIDCVAESSWLRSYVVGFAGSGLGGVRRTFLSSSMDDSGSNPGAFRLARTSEH